MHSHGLFVATFFVTLQGLAQVFEGVRNKKGVRASPSRDLTKGEKKRRVVLKRVNADNLGMRSDFLRSGTMAQVQKA